MSKNAKRQLKIIQDKNQAEDQARFQAKLQELISLATAKGEGCLDEFVHDLKAGEASSINNSGVQDQVNYIVESQGLENAIIQIEGALK
ncbi:MAG: hypothetical protein IMZ61_11510 [Planctomycetes bacterium]|nr:hypothetical protein [Planctomycetota bacterium]